MNNVCQSTKIVVCRLYFFPDGLPSAAGTAATAAYAAGNGGGSGDDATDNPASIEVSFDVNGGEGLISPVVCIVGKEYGYLPTPKKNGYSFLGWFTMIDGGEMVRSSTPVTSSISTLYARWVDDIWEIDDGVLYSVATDSTELVVPDGIVEIRPRCFSACSSLEAVTFPESVTKVGGMTFMGLENMQSVIILGAITNMNDTVGVGMFYDLSYSPDMVIYVTSKWNGLMGKSYGDYTNVRPLPGTPGICTVMFDANGGTADFASMDYLAGKNYGDLPAATKDGASFVGWATAKMGGEMVTRQSVVHASNLKLYARWADEGWKIEDGELKTAPLETDIVIPDGVCSIGYGVFRDRTSLLSVTFPSSVTNIGDYAFSGCRELKTLTIPASVGIIGEEAFSSCEKLESIEILSEDVSLGWCVFLWCDNLKVVSFAGMLENYDASDINAYANTSADLVTYVTSKWTGPTDTWCGRRVVVVE